MIKKTDTIAEIVNKWPNTIELFSEIGMHCFGCVASQFENIEQGAIAHGVNPETFIRKLNEFIESQEDS